MPRPDSGNAPLDHRHLGHKPVCPVCQANVVRMPRLLKDRFVSLFVLVHRYRCARMPCNWEGTLRVPYIPQQQPQHLMRRRASD